MKQNRNLKYYKLKKKTFYREEENVRTWVWGRTTKVQSIVIGDVDGDASTEIVTAGNFNGGYAGYYNEATRDISQLLVWGEW